MINIIICDDNKDFLLDISNFVTDFFEKMNVCFKVHLFDDYNLDFFDLMKSNLDNKIYILDIETPSANGVDIGRKIRKDDLNSFLIYVSSYSEKYIQKTITSDTMFMGYITKDNFYKDNILKSLNKILNCGFKNQVIRFKDQGIIYTFDLRSILYIYACSKSRRSIIHTVYGEFPVKMTLKQLKEILDYRFEYSHRCCIINEENTLYIDTVVKVIKFKNGEAINMMSEGFANKIKKRSNAYSLM